MFVSDEKAIQLAANIARPGDVIFTQRGTLGQVAIVPKTPFERYVVSQSQMKLTVDSQKADTLFVYYYFRSDDYLEYLDQHTIQTGVPHTNLSILRNTPVPLPPLPIQRRIAEILGRLDDKIEANRRINRTLEAMAQALYKHWFVDFGPFQDGQFVESELGLIPAGWEVGTVYESAQFINGAAYRKFNPNREGVGLPIIKIAELKNGVTDSTLHSEEDIDEKYHIDDGDILFSWSGNPDTSLDVFTWTGGHALLNQHIFLVETARPEERYFVYFMLKHFMPTFAEIARNKQTTGLGHVTVRDLKEMPVVRPPRDILNRFARYAGRLFELRFGRLLESRKLAATRDYLLPKLLSGEVDVRDAENARSSIATSIPPAL